MFKTLFLSLSLLASFTIPGTGAVDEDVKRNLRWRSGGGGGSDSIVDIAINTPDFSTLVSAIQIAGLVHDLDCSWPYWFCDHKTVFAPTDTAFSNVDRDLLTKLTQDARYHQHLADLLLYHITPGSVKSGDINDGDIIRTLQGETLEASVGGGAISIIDSLDEPANVEEPFDVVAKNGVIHSINKVLVPSFLTKNIYQVAQEAGGFSKLLAAVDRVGLKDTLENPDANFTLFAPTDAAFEALEAEIGDLGAVPDDTLAKILTYHVLPTAVPFKQLSEGAVTTVEGSDIKIAFQGFWFWVTVSVNDAHVEAVDILGSNGVIHVIDKVLSIP